MDSGRTFSPEDYLEAILVLCWGCLEAVVGIVVVSSGSSLDFGRGRSLQSVEGVDTVLLVRRPALEVRFAVVEAVAGGPSLE